MEKFRSALLKNKTFPLLTALLCAAAFAGGHMFVKYGYGLFNEIAQAEMVRNGLDTGDFATPIGYCTGFLLARVMEGPLVGILDIGGSIMTGIGTGMVSLAKSVGLDILVDSFARSDVQFINIGEEIMVGQCRGQKPQMGSQLSVGAGY